MVSIKDIPHEWELKNDSNQNINTVADLERILINDITNKVFYYNNENKIKIIYRCLSKDWWVISMNDDTENKIFDDIHSALNNSIKRME